MSVADLPGSPRRPTVFPPRPALLHGRTSELARLRGVLDDPSHGAFVLLEGEAGIGKTRLLEWMAATARTLGYETCVGACDPLVQGPFGALLDALDCRPDHVDAARAELATLARSMTHAPDRFGFGAEPFGRYAVQDALIELIAERAESRAQLLGIDDAHWTDEATCATLAALSRRLEHARLVVVLTTRTFPRSAEIETLLDRLDPPAVVMRLEPLAPGAVAAITADLTGAVPTSPLRAELERAGGNPFMVQVVVSAAAASRAARAGVAEAGAPAAVTSSSVIADGTHGFESARDRDRWGQAGTILRRLGVLPPEVREVLDVAAVVGDECRPDQLAQLLGRPVSSLLGPLTTSVRAGILEERDGRLAFRHHLFRETLYDEVPASIRRAVHRDVWLLLAAEGASALAIAHHASFGGRPGEADAVQALRNAAQGVAGTDTATAVALLDRAAELAGVGSGLQLAVVRDKVAALTWSGRLGEAEALARRGVADAAGSLLEGPLRQALAQSVLRQGHLGAAAVELEAACSCPLEPHEEAQLRSELAFVRLFSFDGRRALDEAIAAAELASAVGNVEAEVQALNVASLAAGIDGAVDAGLAYARRAVERGTAMRPCTRPAPALFLGLALVNADRLAEAMAVLADGRARVEAARDPAMEGRFCGVLALAGLLSGAFDDVVADAAAGERVTDDTGIHAGLPLAPAATGLVAFHRGDVGAARLALARARAAASTPDCDRSGLPIVGWLDAYLAEHDGRPGAASESIGATLDLIAAVAPQVVLWIGLDAIRFALGAGDGTRATAAARTVAVQAAKAATPTGHALAELARSLVAQDADGIARAATALAATERAFETARACEDAGVAMADANRVGEAVAWMGDAARRFEELGAEHHVRRVAAVAEGLDAAPRLRVRRLRVVAAPALSGSTRQVAELVARGHSNVEIARQLYLSKRTVEWHVSELYKRCGATNRVALARLLGDLVAG
jgi:DNA-binding NarL/FixJ family response regulator